MAYYIVGDIQGCFSELSALLAQVNFDRQQDTLYFAGDLVARGPDSLATLRFVKSLGAHGKVVLGNHDLHLLSVYAGIKKVKAADKLDELLAADDIHELMTWLAQQPLIQKLPTSDNEHAYLSHAGLSPQWQIKEALTQANLAQEKLQSPQRDYWLKQMYGEQPNNWSDAHNDIEKFRYTINSLTRMRYCFADGSLEFLQKSAPSTLINQSNPSQLTPWFNLTKLPDNHYWLFGHWASLMGETHKANMLALDTGCVWGNYLTMLRWHDKKVFIETAHKK